MVAVKTNYYTIYLENYLNRLWVHVDVLRWTPSIRKDYQIRFDRLMDKLGQVVYAINMPWDFEKRHKFMLMTGWQFYKKRKMPHGGDQNYDVYRRYPNVRSH